MTADAMGAGIENYQVSGQRKNVVLEENLRIVYVEHFWEQFKDRGRHSPVPLTIELVEDAIKNPDLVMQDPKYPEREWRIKKIGGRCFKVIVENAGEEIVAITLMFDRTLRRKGLCK